MKRVKVHKNGNRFVLCAKGKKEGSFMLESDLEHRYEFLGVSNSTGMDQVIIFLAKKLK